MRIKTYVKGGYSDGGFTSGGGTMTGPLILAANPLKDLEATPKQYVDALTANYDAGKFTVGTLQVGRLPVFVGDVVNTAGSNALSLAASGVSGGVFTKVTVNAKGLVTAGGSLVEADLPNLDWSKITTGKPTTLAGYGITDGLAKSGGTITGNLTLSGDPTQANHIATKQYVDNSAGTFSALKPGDVVYKLTNSTPAGFFRCNGGDVNQTTYSALYAAVGDTFSTGTLLQPGAGQPWSNQYDISTNNTATGLAAFTNATTGLPTGLSSGSIVVTKNYVYYICGAGSLGGQIYSSYVYMATIYADGTIAGWTQMANRLPWYQEFTRAVVTKNRIYVFGGFISTDGSGNSGTTSYTSTACYSVINTDGTIGPWVSITAPGISADFFAFITVSRLYVVSRSAASYAPINADGTLGAWVAVNAQAPGALINSYPMCGVTKNRIFVVSSNGLVCSAPINADGSLGTWVANTGMPTSLSSADVVVTKTRLYVIGGNVNVSTTTNTVYMATINADGSLGAWTTTSTLATAAQDTRSFLTSSTLYVIGGNNYTNGWLSTVQMSPLTGGLNDYTAYYNGSLTSVAGPAPGYFRLPDLTNNDPSGMYSYIKY